MRLKYIAALCLMLTGIANASSLTCSEEETPRVIRTMENWNIISSNVGTIPTESIFSGDDKTYSVVAHPRNPQNSVTIGKNTGVVRIEGQKKDRFDVIVTAKNQCGSASTKFNIAIGDEA